MVAKAFDDCVEEVLADPDFEPSGQYETKDEAARAICAAKESKRTKQEEDDVHVHTVILPDGEAVTTGPPEHLEPEAELEIEPIPVVAEGAAPKRAPTRSRGEKANVAPGSAPRETIARAYTARKADALPADARTIFDRMRDSYLRYAAHRKASGFGRTKGGRPLEDYADVVAWRGVAQAFDLEPAATKAVRKPATKAIIAPVIGSSDGGSYFVPLLPKFRDAALHHERIFRRPVPGSGGVVLQVGITRPSGRKNLIGVFVPYEVASREPGGVGAIGWVQRNYELLHRVGHAEVDLAASVREPILKFVPTATSAKERIAYGVVYTPWEVDLQGQFASAKSVQEMAHRFVAGRSGRAKVMHRRLTTEDGAPVGDVVESFIARPDDPDYPAGSWVLGVKWHEAVWPDVAAERLRGFSMGGNWTVVPIEAAA